MAQTTVNPSLFAKVLKNIVTDKCKTVEIFDTICYTTKERNVEVSELAASSDACVVVGGRNSSNTGRLFSTARERCANVFWIERADELQPEKLKKFKNVSIVAGASTPIELIKEVKSAMSEINTNEALEIKDSIQETEAPAAAAETVSTEAEAAVENTENVSAEPETVSETPETVSAEAEPASEEAETQPETASAETEAASDAQPEEATQPETAAAPAEEPASEEVPAEESVASEETPAEADVNPLKGDGEFTMEDVMNDLNKRPVLRRGRVLKTTIVMATDEGVMLQNGAKGELLLPKAEISLDDTFDKAAFIPGEELEVLVTNVDPLQVSRKALLLNAIEDEQVAKLGGGETFKVKVDGFNKGGLTAKHGSYSVFIPASQIRIGYVKPEDLEKYVGKEIKLKALKIERRNITGSARPVIEEERAVKDAERKIFLEQFFSTIEVGHVVAGKVVRFAAFGAFVNVNGFDCLAHISDLAWTNVKRAEDVLKKDQVYEFVVLKVDPENQRVSIGYKQLQPKPWDMAAEKYPAGSTITGKVVRIAGFGAFVEVEPGIDGLVHVSQISSEWIENPTSVLKVGQEVEAKVLDIRPEEEKLTLSIKALTGGGDSESRPDAPRRQRRTAEDVEGVEYSGGAASDRIQKFERREKEFHKEKRDRRPREDSSEPREWSSTENNGASIGELLKGLNLNLPEEEEKTEE